MYALLGEMKASNFQKYEDMVKINGKISIAT
jgi:hypothetical protein